MSDGDPIIRLAARGDGVTASGEHVAGTAPGDAVLPSGKIERGPHYQKPPCRHFEHCGGCELQHVDDDSMARFVTERVVNAAAGQSVDVENVAVAHLSPPRSRRRATLHGIKHGKNVQIGFRQGKSHKIINLNECPVLRSELFSLVKPLRKVISFAEARGPIDVEIALVDQGPVMSIKGIELAGLEATESMLDFAGQQGLARLSLDQGYGAEAMWEPEPATITLSGIPVGFPDGAFLQATEEGETELVEAANAWLGGAKSVVDLFSGLGTFAFALIGANKRVLAVEAARDPHLACQMAARARGLPVEALHRDLFRNPLTAAELNNFEAALLDPPRAGARDQISQIADSTINRVAYISCNPSSWARDAKVLVDAGFRCVELRPVGQFRWSTHVELASLFVRD